MSIYYSLQKKWRTFWKELSYDCGVLAVTTAGSCKEKTHSATDIHLQQAAIDSIDQDESRARSLSL
jgi:hypothetical protein